MIGRDGGGNDPFLQQLWKDMKVADATYSTNGYDNVKHGY